MLEEAGTRIHGTTREQPLERFLIEKPLLQALPAIAPDLGSWNRVKLHRDCHVKFDHSLYSAPFTLVGQRLWLRATDTTVSIFQDYRLVATHLRSRKHGERRTQPDHLPPHARAFFARDRRWCVEQAQRIGPNCAALIEVFLGDRIVERLRGAQGILSFAQSYGSARLEAACLRALVHDSPHYRTVKTILATGYDQQSLQPHQASTSVYGEKARFVRSLDSLFEDPARNAAMSSLTLKEFRS